MYLVIKELPKCLPKVLYHFALPSAMSGGLCCSVSSPVFGVSILDFGHSNRCQSFGYVCLLQILSQFLSGILIFLTLSFTEQKFQILMKSSLGIISFLNYVFGVVAKQSSLYPRSI